jgi:hypothetical protein
MVDTRVRPPRNASSRVILVDVVLVTFDARPLSTRPVAEGHDGPWEPFMAVRQHDRLGRERSSDRHLGSGPLEAFGEGIGERFQHRSAVAGE